MLDLTPYVNTIREQLLVAAQAGGDEARELAERLTAPLDSAVRLTLLEALEQAAAEITREIAPGSVELRLRAGSPEFVVTEPTGAEDADAHGYGDLASAAMDAAMSWVSGAPGEREMARLNLRLPEQLKTRIDATADRAGLSSNAWLVRVAATAVESEQRGSGPAEPKRRRGARNYKGWVR
jgi:hypothetical protein